MTTRRLQTALPLAAALLLASCAATRTAQYSVDTGSAAPGGAVLLKGKPEKLLGTPLQVGSPIPATDLVDAFTMAPTNLADLRGKVLFVSVVPSLDTKVCEAQTHYLAEKGGKMPSQVVRITISRDTPFAQKRFAEEAKLTSLTYLSDYKEGAFGRATGLLQDGSRLLARAVILVDARGIVRYIQVVPELSHLPDMEAAFLKAEALAKEP